MSKFGPPFGKETLVRYILKYRFQFIVSSIAGILYNTVIVLGPILLGRLIDAAASASAQVVLVSASYFVGITVFFQFARFVKRWYMRDQFNHIACDLRQTLLDRILGRSLVDIDGEIVGDLMSRTVGDITLVVDTVMSTLNEGWDTWLLMVSYFAVLLYMDWKITLIASILVPLTLFIAHSMRDALYKCSMDARTAAATANTGLVRYLNAITVLRLFGRESAESEGIVSAYKKHVRYTIKQVLLQQSLLPVYALLAGLGVVLVIGLGGAHVKDGIWTVGTFNAYMVMYIAFTGRTRVAAKVFNRWHGAKAAWKRVNEKLTNSPQKEDLHSRVCEDVLDVTHLNVSNLSFSYGSNQVLEGISFEASKGQIIGVTGAVGSGKTTLIHALLGQYAYKGDVLVDQRQLRDFSEEAIQKLISYSGHEQFLFSMSIKDNISLGAKDSSVDLSAILRACALEVDLKRFDKELDTLVGEKGLRVSGGQRQRIALARAMASSAPIILLDDPFSALDLATEQRIIGHMRETFKNQIVIIATHRLSAFVGVDDILVLKDGRILEKGKHDALVGAEGLYSSIFKAQQFIEGGASHD
jgi:ATP-binding cassette subfamily B multidrug efflux pump